MNDKNTEPTISPQQRTLWALLMEALRRDLEACGLSGRELSRARIQVALHGDDRCLARVLGLLAEHRRAHLN
ncbi:MAG: hypothetical protein ACYCX3_01180 [Thermoleophilia bacterium]